MIVKYYEKIFDKLWEDSMGIPKECWIELLKSGMYDVLTWLCSTKQGGRNFPLLDIIKYGISNQNMDVLKWVDRRHKSHKFETHFVEREKRLIIMAVRTYNPKVVNWLLQNKRIKVFTTQVCFKDFTDSDLMWIFTKSDISFVTSLILGEGRNPPLRNLLDIVESIEVSRMLDIFRKLCSRYDMQWSGKYATGDNIIYTMCEVICEHPNELGGNWIKILRCCANRLGQSALAGNI